MASSKDSRQPPNDNTSGQTPMGNSTTRLIIFIVLGLLAFQLFSYYENQKEEITLTKFQQEVLAKGQVEKIEVVNKEVAEIYLKPEALSSYSQFKENTPGPHFQVNIGSVETFERLLNEAQQNVPIAYVKRTDWWGTLLAWLLPFAIIIGIWMFIMGRMRRSGGGIGGNIFDFGKSKAVLFDKSKSQVTFNDVAGLDEVKVEVREIVDFLKNPQRYTRLGAKIPKGVLLIGLPGTGKTLLAKAVAGEAGVPFYSISGSEFVEMFVGVGASRVRDLFRKAKENAPGIIFIDEIDAIGRSRGKTASFQSNDERENTLNQLLAEMDGFGSNTGIIVMAATNRGEILDRALMRPGRFDRQIYVELPTLNERKAIFTVHTKNLKLGGDIDLDTLAAHTPGFSGADIANICNEAALIAARADKEAIHMSDFYAATDRVIGGLEKKSRIISAQEKEIIAYHEAGHATVSWYLKHADPLLKVSIIPRGKSLGSAWYLPKENVIYTTAQLTDRICAALGGRAAEAVVFGEISSGALDDLEKVTKQAYAMVAYYGLDDEIGNISFYDSTGSNEQMFHKPYSEATAQRIDEEVQKLIEAAYERTKGILIEHRREMEELARQLLQKEVVYKKDLEQIFDAPIYENENVGTQVNS